MRTIGLAIGSALLGLAAGGCGGDDGVVCGQGTVESTDGICQVDVTACGAGLGFNEETGQCERGLPPAGAELLYHAGTELGTAHNTYQWYAYLDGDTPVPLAPGAFEEPEAPDDTVVVMLSGRPLNQAKLDVSSFNFSEQQAPTLHDGGDGSGETQFTLGDMKQCKHDMKIYRLESGLYRMVYSLTDCLPNMLYTTWISYTPEAPADPTDLDQFREAQGTFAGVAAAGGLPHSMTTDPDGNGFKIIDVNPDFYFKAGAVCAGGFGCTPNPPFGPPSQFEISLEGGIWFDIQMHTTGQNNGNAGSCYMRDDGTCIQTADEYPFEAPFNEHIFWIGREGDDAGHIASIFLDPTQLQP